MQYNAQLGVDSSVGDVFGSFIICIALILTS